MLEPIRWINLRRNEVASVVSTRNVEAAMRAGKGDLGLFIEDDRRQRAGLFLRNVAYRVHAELEFIRDRDPGGSVARYLQMFERRARKGQCVNQPYLGCREFAAAFRLVDDVDAERENLVAPFTGAWIETATPTQGRQGRILHLCLNRILLKRA